MAPMFSLNVMSTVRPYSRGEGEYCGCFRFEALNNNLDIG